MKHDTQTLLLADAVRTLAKEKRSAAQMKALAQSKGAYKTDSPARTDEQQQERVDFKEDWLSNNPLSAFFLDALQELEAIADLMKPRLS